MMPLRTILTLSCTKSAVQCSSKKRALEIISEIAATQLGEENITELFESMLNREKMGSTGIGNGVAIPNARISSSDQPLAIFLQCEEPIEFDANDNRPVDLLFALLVPDAQCKEHSTTLATIAERLSDKALLKQLRHAESDEQLYELIIENDELLKPSKDQENNIDPL